MNTRDLQAAIELAERTADAAAREYADAAFIADLPPLPDEPADMRGAMLDLLRLAERDWTLTLADGREVVHPTIKRAREVIGVQS